MRLVVVEDNDTLRDSIVKALLANGHFVYGVSNRRVAIGLLNDCKAKGEIIDGLILDMRLPLPELTGHEFLNEMLAQNISTPVMLLTQSDEPLKDLTPDTSVLVKRIFMKPFRMDEFTASAEKEFSPMREKEVAT